MDEEEISRGGRGGRGGRAARHTSGGMSFATKAALITGGATLLVMAIALAMAGRGPDATESMDDAGHAAVQMLARTDPSWWAGGSTGVDPIKHTQRVFVDLFGETGKTWWENQTSFRETPFTQTDEWAPDERDRLKEAKRQYTAGEEKWSGGGAEDPAKDATVVLTRLAGPGSPIVRNPGYIIVGAWIREAAGLGEGPLFASYPASDRIRYDWTGWSTADPQVEGEVAGNKVTIYTGDLGKPPKGKPLRAYVALMRNPQAPKPGGGGNLGIVLAILGPLLVGGLAYAIAGAHTKNVRSLAREIDRLGSSGDATRTLRAQGGDAAMVARAVERMVGHLEFRSKHGDADLEEIAEKERKVAEEIHSALISKNPPRLSNYEVETLYKPGFEIAGDHFEYFPIDQHHLGVILLDTNVRGLPAALVMASARSYVRAAAPGELSPAAVLKTVNRNLAGDLPAGRHVTALYVVIDTREGKATIASAGHLPLIVYRHASGKVAKVNPEGIALGLDHGPVFERALQEGDIPIGLGDRIVLYTDGALNISNEYGEEYGESRFYESVAREAPKNSQAFVNFVGSAIDQFHLNATQDDDITISTVKRLK
jgi:serine phosphatase RsbU (regulator of sigma subunit)